MILFHFVLISFFLFLKREREQDAKARAAGQKVMEEKVIRLMKNRSVNATFAKIDVKDIVWANPGFW